MRRDGRVTARNEISSGRAPDRRSARWWCRDFPCAVTRASADTSARARSPRSAEWFSEEYVGHERGRDPLAVSRRAAVKQGREEDARLHEDEGRWIRGPHRLSV